MINYVHNISVEDYNYLRESVGWSKIDAIQAQTGINNSTYLIVAVDKNKTVGLSRLVSDGGYIAIIVDVIVLPEYQGSGIGRHMMQKVMDNISEKIKNGQKVLVNLISANGRESFYSQFGFNKCPNENSGSGMTQWICKNR